VKLVLQFWLLGSLLDETRHSLQFIFSTSLDPSRIVEYEIAAKESDLMFDVVLSTLKSMSQSSE